MATTEKSHRPMRAPVVTIQNRASGDRRSSERFAASYPATLLLHDYQHDLITTHAITILNICQSGLSFRTDREIDLGVSAEIIVELPISHKSVSFRGWLTWEDSARHVYGIHCEDSDAGMHIFFDEIISLTELNQKDRRDADRRRSADVLVIDRRVSQRRHPKPAHRNPRAELSAYDRRHGLRIKLDIPAQLRIGIDINIEGRALSLSETGFSIRVQQTFENPISGTMTIPIGDTGTKQIFPIHCIWHISKNGSHFYGGRFLKLSETDQCIIRTFMAKALENPHSVTDRRLRSAITSDLITYKNREGMTIVGYHDHRAVSNYKMDPLLIIPSAYAETKKDSIQMAYYLVNNGFQVIRYDNTNHTGESQGDILHIKLSNFKNDILSTLDYVEKTLLISKIGVVARSLAARTAIKAAAEDKRIVFLLCFVPSVDVRYTLNAVYCEDLVGTYRAGKLWGITNVLGCNTYLDGFLQDGIDNRYHDFETTLEDVRRIVIPFVLLVAEQDPWVDFRSVIQVLSNCPSTNKEMHVIPAMHQLKENPKAARAAFRLITASAIKYTAEKEIVHSLQIQEPSFRWLAVQNRIERQRIKLLTSFEKKTEQFFWTKYLDQFHFICKLPDYHELLKSMHENLHGIHPGERVLDAGSGNGTFSLWLLAWFALRGKNDHETLNSTVSHPVELHSVDYVARALDESKLNHERLAKQLFGKDLTSPVLFCYRIADLDALLPYPDGYFDKVVSNLVISYLRNSVQTIKEFIRVTKKGGRIVISSLKPYADTSKIYRNYVQTKPGEDNVQETRKLLNNAGDINLKESEGHFNFFSEDELEKMAMEAGATDVCLVRSFADQANILIIEC